MPGSKSSGVQWGPVEPSGAQWPLYFVDKQQLTPNKILSTVVYEGHLASKYVFSLQIGIRHCYPTLDSGAMYILFLCLIWAGHDQV